MFNRSSIGQELKEVFIETFKDKEYTKENLKDGFLFLKVCVRNKINELEKFLRIEISETDTVESIVKKIDECFQGDVKKTLDKLQKRGN